MMNYEKMLFFPKTEMSTRSSSLPPPLQLQPQSNLTTATSTASSTPPAAFLTPSPEAYTAYAYADADADTFDLSLLPNESDLPLGSDGSHEFLPRTTAATTTTPPLTAAAAAESTRTESTSPQIKIEQSWARDCVKSEFESLPAPANYDQLQQSQCHQQCQPQCQQGQCQQGQCQQHLLRPKSQSLLVPPPPAYPTALAAYPSPQSSPAQSGDYGFPTPFGSACSSLSSSRSSLYPPSPCPSLDTTNPTTTTTASPISSSSSPCNATAFPTSAAIPIASSPVQIKQEFHILPPSPPESSCEAPSPPSFADIKSEPLDTDVETLIDINSLLESSLKDLRESTRPQARSRAQPPAAAQSRSQSLGSSGFLEIKQEGAATAATAPSTTMAATAPQSQAQSQCCSSIGNGQDHQLLREYLEDTSFQKKHNLKPLALESLIGGLGERGDIEPVISLALEYAKLEAEATCAKLQISPDPKTWTAGQTHAWLRSTIDQFQLPPLDDLELRFPEDGTTLALLTEEEFVRRAPEIGSTIHAQLEIWKLVYSNGFQEDFAPTQPALGGAEGPGVWTADCDQPMAMDIDVDMDVSDDEDDEDVLPPTSVLAAAAGVDLATAASSAASGAATKPVGATPARNGGSHIHLWQFLKELLAAPHLNGTAIRWIDRSKGVFKIEDSVRVAKLWGRRKNRPAMNYDKLSRSIRQYYKKGIMKKTERSQRLVYQFCHPYSL